MYPPQHFACIGASSVGVNPKINNMLCAFNAAKYEVLWISDSGILGEPIIGVKVPFILFVLLIFCHFVLHSINKSLKFDILISLTILLHTSQL